MYVISAPVGCINWLSRFASFLESVLFEQNQRLPSSVPLYTCTVFFSVEYNLNNIKI